MEHIDKVQRCVEFASQQWTLNAAQKENLSIFHDNVCGARDMLSCFEDGDEDDGVEWNEELVDIMREHIVAARDMVTLDDSAFGLASSPLDEPSILAQLSTYLVLNIPIISRTR